MAVGQRAEHLGNQVLKSFPAKSLLQAGLLKARRKPAESRILGRILSCLMQTTHSVLFGPAQQTLTSFSDGSIDLVVTSLTYPD